MCYRSSSPPHSVPKVSTNLDYKLDEFTRRFKTWEGRNESKRGSVCVVSFYCGILGPLVSHKNNVNSEQVGISKYYHHINQTQIILFTDDAGCFMTSLKFNEVREHRRIMFSSKRLQDAGRTQTHS